MAALKGAKSRLAEVQASLAELQDKYHLTLSKKEMLADQVEECRVKLERAQKLIGGLGGERERWSKGISELGIRYEHLTGDVLVSAGVIAYCGAFTANYRCSLVDDWKAKIQTLYIPLTDTCDLKSTLADPVQVRAWHLAGLPTDAVSVENGIVMSKAKRWPLMIDPQGQANRFIKNLAKNQQSDAFDVIKLSDKNFVRSLETGIRFGKWILLENINQDIDPILEPVLLRQKFKQSGQDVIRLGDSVVTYDPNFRFFLTTKLPNPHYTPEVSVKVTLLNFTITPEGLKDQLLGLVVAKESPTLEEKKNRLVVANAQMKRELQELEDKILYLLSSSTGNLLDDETLINTLDASKTKSEEISAKVREAEATEIDIDAARNSYTPVAYRASILFFTISDLLLIDPMYQYSLTWFISLFTQGIGNAAASEDLALRLSNLNEFFTLSLYRNICRSLFERHKLLFSFLVCIKILQGDNQIDAQEWRFLLAGPSSGQLSSTVPNPAPTWLVQQQWLEIQALSQLSAFENFHEEFTRKVAHWQDVFDSVAPQDEPLPGDWQEKLSDFQRLLVLRCIRPDKITTAVQQFVSKHLGEPFVEPPPFNLAESVQDSSAVTPLIFILSAGADPFSELTKFADEKRMLKKLSVISLGQGQGVLAAKMIDAAVKNGDWVLLQNCHLASSWMLELERICEQLDGDKVDPNFRLWLTSMPSTSFPVSILQNGIKMTNEPPKGIRANLTRSLLQHNDETLTQCKKPEAYKKLLFSLCFFHALIQERRKFGPIGWNIPYEYTMEDLQVCQKQLKLFLDEKDEIPFKVIRFLAGEINYGGRVTDDIDRRTMRTVLMDFVTPAVLTEGYQFSPSGAYVSPPALEHRSYMEYIASLPLNPAPEVFGLHANAEISTDQNETRTLLESLLSLQPRGSVGVGTGVSREQILDEAARAILQRLPEEFDVEEISRKYPTTYSESMNTVLVQEAIRYQKLTLVMKQSLQELLKALKGLVVMSESLEHMSISLFDNSVPEIWSAKAYPSLKPLGLWIDDLLKRLDFIRGWIQNGIPKQFWFSGFFFPQAFLTGTLQNYARKHVLPIDTLSFDFKIVTNEEIAAMAGRPDDGCLIYGLYMEGARWDPRDRALADSKPKELYSEVPPIWLRPKANRKPPSAGVYFCPVYKVLSRAGTLSTTGHSTNFVLFMELPTHDDQEKWIKAGVAMFCSLRY
eukprot:GILK01007882.1.p1 GENE.GILK01007882.1~~GILK01007882.1.p1  ORF type:complete len:1232 (+),score=259.13 GILK01007882.1:87-3698(+)